MVGKNKHRQPIIGITMGYDKGRHIHEGIDYSFVRREYGRQLQLAGAQPIFLDSSIDAQTAAELCDGIVISGGEDIDPAFYGQEKTSDHNLEPRERTQWERELLVECDKHKVRVLGICYGAQLLNVHYGGTLYQDIATEFTDAIDHGASFSPALHAVTFEHDFLGFKKGDSVSSTSRHHQAVRSIAPGFKAMARAKDGVIEAIAGNGHYGVQWHPESDGTAPAIYGEFVRLCSQQFDNRPLDTSRLPISLA